MPGRVIFVQQYSIFKTQRDLENQFRLEMDVLREQQISFSCVTAAEDGQTLLRQLEGAEILLCWGNPPLDKTVIRGLPDLKMILRYGIGVNSIDLAEANRRGIVVYYMPDSSKEELAHHALSMILGLLRNTVRYDRMMRKGVWDKAGGTAPRRMQNLTLGIFGLGNSGKALVKMVRGGFGSRVLACDPFVGVDEALTLGVELCDFERLVVESDIVSLHAPLTEETRFLFNKTVFRKMKKTALLINISRGELVCEEDLAMALFQGEIGGAGLDVYQVEPLPHDSPLLGLENVILSPHSAFFGEESALLMKESAAALLQTYFGSHEIDPAHVANKAVLRQSPELQPKEREAAR